MIKNFSVIPYEKTFIFIVYDKNNIWENINKYCVDKDIKYKQIFIDFKYINGETNRLYIAHVNGKGDIINNEEYTLSYKYKKPILELCDKN
ncbi:MAG: hypothetical protein RSC92_01790 [Clostridia bacterium]